MSNAALDTFMCVHRRDVDYLLGTVLLSYRLNFQPQRKLTIVTNDRPYLQDALERLGLSGQEVQLSSDSDWLSSQELSLPGWYRQQVIKLRAYEFCETENFCNLGADTVLLEPIAGSDLVKDGLPVLYYTRHSPPDLHYLYEWQRVNYVGRILRIKPTVARRYVDFINDLFCFNRQELIDLNRYLQKLYGADCYYQLLKDFGKKPADQKKFGEWTLYSMYLLGHGGRAVELRETAGFLRQIHSLRVLKRFKFDAKVVHFVGKNFDVGHINAQLIRRNAALSNYVLTYRPAVAQEQPVSPAQVSIIAEAGLPDN